MPRSSSFTAFTAGAGLRQAPRSPVTVRSPSTAIFTATAAAAATATEGPSCLFVGPVDTASKEMLEALYQQARNSYYSGKPLIVDAMFDKVELQLRLYGSKSVIKYPRCSIMRHSTYADAEEDPSQVLALATVWILLLAFGSFTFLVPTILTISAALEDTFKSRFFLNDKKYPFNFAPMLNSALFVVLGFSVAHPIAASSVEALEGLWMKKLVALKGCCPNCGEEVFAFMKAENSILRPHGTLCHVCQSGLEFRGKVVQSTASHGRRCVYGRVYLVTTTRA